MNTRSIDAGDRHASRRERERQMHRDAILQAAEAVFAEQGFEGATMEAVAARAEFSVGSLYNFFSGKDHLYAEVLRKIAEDYRARFEEVLRTAPTPLDAIRASVRLHFEEIERHGPFFRALLADRPGARLCPDSAIPEECRQQYDAYLDALADLIRHAVAAGQVRPVDPQIGALMLEGTIHAASAFWHRRNEAVPLERRIALITEHIVDGLLAVSKEESSR